MRILLESNEKPLRRSQEKQQQVGPRKSVPTKAPRSCLSPTEEKQPPHKSIPTKTPRVSKSSLSSTEEDEDPKTSSKKITPPIQHEKRKTSPQKSIPQTGGKVPPSVLAMQHNKSISAKSLISKSLANKASSKKPPIATSKSSNDKKKSIFSPDNSSETTDDEKPPTSSSTKGDRRASGSSNTGRGRGRPRKYPVPNKTSKNSSKNSTIISSEKPKQETKKEAVSSATSTTESSTASSNSDNSESESASETKPSRKSIRQSSVRKSKHVAGVKSETETDDSMKRSTTKSPAKKVSTLIPTKGKSKQKRIEQKHNLNLSKDSQPEEKGCPYDGCNSNGHLSGKFDKHFILEACPLYHNFTLADTKQNLFERKKRSEERVKALSDFEPKKPQTTEQKTYLQKIRELRSKFKPTSKQNDDHRHDEKEPNLNGIVSEYDLQLFRDAQALASENIENELKQLPCQGSVKFLVLGKHNMDVWYQSVYPEDVQRLPKLWLCEFCLRYQKSEVGMKRHAAKCVWRHPPGDQIYRKGRLCVWQVDGKRQKNYCQYLCLLAKFFLDHKTLYFDVDPFLFYIMTIADSDGCHLVGYFSKVSLTPLTPFLKQFK